MTTKTIRLFAHVIQNSIRKYNGQENPFQLSQLLADISLQQFSDHRNYFSATIIERKMIAEITKLFDGASFTRDVAMHSDLLQFNAALKLIRWVVCPSLRFVPGSPPSETAVQQHGVV